MKTLYLLRHAHTTPAVPPLMGDHERILSAEGVRDALDVGRYMEARDMYPDFVLSSSSVRTIQTARTIFGVLFRRPGMKVGSHFNRRFYQAPAVKLLSEIHALDAGIDRLMVVAHNPGVSDLAMILSGDEKFGRYDPGTLAVFRADCESWDAFSPGTARLEEVFVPG